jgi:hypothetical protein
MEKLLNEIINKFAEITQRDLKNKYYDYLILNINKKKEIDEIINFIIKNKINIDLYFFINTRFKKKKLYIQISDSKENKDITTENLKKIHNFFRIKYNKNISFKNSSKHSVFFEGKNFLLSSSKTSYKFINLKLIKNINIQQILLAFNTNLTNLYMIEIKDEYKTL